MLFMSITTFAATPADTIKVDNTQITEVIEHKTTNSKGNPTIKYYFVYQGELVNTNNTTITKYKLCKQYKAKCPLVMIVRGNNKRIVLY